MAHFREGETNTDCPAYGCCTALRYAIDPSHTNKRDEKYVRRRQFDTVVLMVHTGFPQKVKVRNDEAACDNRH